MTCPACGAALREHKIAGIVLDECPACGGIWFDGDELEAYRRQIPTRPRYTDDTFVPDDDLSNRPCPRCRVLTARSGSLSGHRTFHCRNCRGVFLPRSAVMGLGRVKPFEAAAGSSVLDFVDGDVILEVVFEVIAAIADL